MAGYGSSMVDNSSAMSFGDKYNYILTELRDPRVDNWLLMSTPWPTLAFCLIYYYLVRFAGPAFMKGRPAFDVQKLMFAYNFFQTLFSLWIFSRFSGFWLTGKYSWICQPVDYSDSEDGSIAASTVWWYFFSKFTDFMDTFFMVVRHKKNQMTSLHVVHHAMMPVVVWLFLKFVGGGHSTMFMFLNIGVHVVMYFYYFMSSFGPSVQKYLWWKRYITTMQLVQFVTWSIHASLPLFMECNYPKVFVAFLLFLGAFFFTLFTNFYIQSYVKKGAEKAEPLAQCDNVCILSLLVAAVVAWIAFQPAGLLRSEL